MIRLTLWLAMMCLVVLCGSGAFMAAEHLSSGTTMSLSVLGYESALHLHGAAAILTLPLWGSFAGFVAAEHSGWGRLVGWNGLAIALALPVYIGLTAAPEISPELSDALTRIPGSTSFDVVAANRTTIASAASLWAGLVGIGALIGTVGVSPNLGRLFQLFGLVSCGAYLGTGLTSQDPLVPLVFLILPGLALLAITSIQLSDQTKAILPYLWCAALLLSGAPVWASTNYVPNVQNTVYVGFVGHTALFGTAPFVILASLRLRHGTRDTGILDWGFALGFLGMTIVAAYPLYDLGDSGIERGQASKSGFSEVQMRQAAAMGLLFICALTAAISAVWRQPRVSQSVAYGS